MIIEEYDFKAEQVGGTSYLWDLYLLKTIKPKVGPSREELTIDGYGMPLDSVIRRIASFRMNKKHPEEALDMKTYLKEYKDILDKLTEQCRSISIDSAIDESNV